jgi:hypothetical protein
MTPFFFGFYQHVIDVDLDISTNLVMEHSVHEPLVGGPCVLQPERHNLVAKKSSTYDKRCLFLIIPVYHYLIIP